jgi:hypothetical protein
MNAINDTAKSIVPSCMYSINCRIKISKLFLVIVQEQGSYKVFVYLSIPELKLKRSFRNFLKFVPSNGDVKVLDFQNR